MRPLRGHVRGRTMVGDERVSTKPCGHVGVRRAPWHTQEVHGSPGPNTMFWRDWAVRVRC